MASQLMSEGMKTYKGTLFCDMYDLNIRNLV